MSRTDTTRAVDRDILRLAVPALGALIAEPLFLLADTAMVGHLGATPLAGLGLAERDPADDHRAHGLPRVRDDAHGGATARRGRPARRRVIGVDGLWLALGLGAVLALAGWWATPWLVGVFGASARSRPRHPCTSRSRWPACLPCCSCSPRRACCAACRTRARRSGSPASGSPRTSRSTRLHLRARLGHRRVGRRHGHRAVGHGRGVPARDRAARRARGREPLAASCRGAARRGVGWLAVPAHGEPAGRAAARHVGGDVARAPTSSRRIRWPSRSTSHSGSRSTPSRSPPRRSSARGSVQATSSTCGQCCAGACCGASGRASCSARSSSPRPGCCHALFTSSPEVAALLPPSLVVLGLSAPLGGLVFVLDGVLIGAGDARYLAWTGLVNLAVFVPLALGSVWWSDAAGLGGAAALAWLTGVVLDRLPRGARRHAVAAGAGCVVDGHRSAGMSRGARSSTGRRTRQARRRGPTVERRRGAGYEVRVTEGPSRQAVDGSIAAEERRSAPPMNSGRSASEHAVADVDTVAAPRHAHGRGDMSRRRAPCSRRAARPGRSR